MSTVTITRRGEDRARAGHPWIYRSDVTEAERRRRRSRPGDRRARPRGRARALQRRVRDHAAHDRRSGRQRRPPTFVARAARRGDRLSASRCALDATAYRLVHGEADRLPSLIVDRYGDYLVVQALSQGIDRRLPEITAALVELLQPAGILARNDPRVAPARGARAEGRGALRRGARAPRGPRRGRPLRGRSVAGAEDRAVPRPAREPRGGAALRARPPARRLQLQRRLRAGAGAAAASRCWRSTSRPTPSRRIRDNAARNELAQRRGARDERVRRAARARTDRRPLRHHRPRPAGLRQEQGVGAARRCPATRRSTCAR